MELLNLPENSMNVLSWLHSAKFLKTVASTLDLPQHSLPEIAFLGRSNSGKSSCINAITQNKHLAFSSKTPGKTQNLNFFLIQKAKFPDALLCDLPGYGYASASKQEISRWGSLCLDYLQLRNPLCLVVIICDARRGVGDLDLRVVDILRTKIYQNFEFVFLLSKIDKLNRSQIYQCTQSTQKLFPNNKVIPFSSYQRVGISELAETILLQTRKYLNFNTTNG